MSFKKITINIILIIFLVFAMIGLIWLHNLGIAAGLTYLVLFFVGMAFIIIVVLSKIGGVDFWLEIPISKNAERGLLMLILGMVVIGIIFAVSSMSGLNFYSPFVLTPLASFSLNVGAETFSALRAATSPFWQFFITVISASVVEEIVLGFFLVAIGSLILGYGLRKLLKLDFGDGNKHWDFIMAMIFSIIIFSVLHFFNQSYINPDGTWNTQMFMYAAAFRLVLNMMIFRFGNAGLLFSIGVHAVNNAVFLGSETVWAALGTFPGGVIIDSIFILLIVFGIMSIKNIIQEGELFMKDFITFD